MKNSHIAIAITAVVLLILFIGGCSARNGIIEKSNNVDKKWADVEAQYQGRLELIPNLVNTVEAAAQHERNVQVGVTQARTGADKLNAAVAAAKQNPSVETYEELDKQFGLYINAVSEAYPTITATENFKGFQVQMEGVNNRVTKARTDYNKAVEEYNNCIMTFPRSLVSWGFEKRDFFNASPEAYENPDVVFQSQQQQPAQQVAPQPVTQPADYQQMQEENKRLQQELEALKQQQQAASTDDDTVAVKPAETI